MKMVYTNQGTVGTYTFDVNPFPYIHEEIPIENKSRNINAGLAFYNNGLYHSFQLSFTNIGTAQYANFGTIFRTKASITFYPMDETRGTSENFSVIWLERFNFKLTDVFWNSGYSGDIILEST